MSIAGGYYKAVEIAHRCGCDCVQLFTKNNNQWRARPISADEAARFQAALASLGITHPIAHDSYLINLASSDAALWKRSVEAFVEELRRAEVLGLAYVVTHPGAYTSADERTGLKLVAKALDEVHRQTKGLRARCLLETTAGQGTCLGWRFEQLAEILHLVRDSERLGTCFDTCHVFAAGYPLAPEAAYHDTLRQFDALIGLERIKAFHLNDSKRERGSRVDRHEHIGRGKLGRAAFGNLMRDVRFERVPMYLETPKGLQDGEELDVINLRTLRRLCRRRSKAT
jgi:deoxyribonuclease-4